MLEIKLSVSSGLSHVSVMPIRSVLFSLTNSANTADLFLIVLIFMRQPEIYFEPGSGLRLMSSERSRRKDVQGLRFLNVCVTVLYMILIFLQSSMFTSTIHAGSHTA